MSSSPISTLTLREHIRKRPGMYVAGTDTRAMYHLIYEVMDHMVEEAFVGRCKHIKLTLLNDVTVQLEDDSLGISVAQYRDTPRTVLETLMQEIQVSKADLEPEIYQVVGGLFGLGLAVVNALCAEFGLNAVISIRHPAPTFASPTKMQLLAPDIYGPVADLVYKSLFGEGEFINQYIEHCLARKGS